MPEFEENIGSAAAPRKKTRGKWRAFQDVIIATRELEAQRLTRPAVQGIPPPRPRASSLPARGSVGS